MSYNCKQKNVLVMLLSKTFSSFLVSLSWYILPNKSLLSHYGHYMAIMLFVKELYLSGFKDNVENIHFLFHKMIIYST